MLLDCTGTGCMNIEVCPKEYEVELNWVVESAV
jgi:hypothetical protein